MWWQYVCHISNCFVLNLHNDETVFSQRLHSFELNFEDLLFKVLFNLGYSLVQLYDFSPFQEQSFVFSIDANEIDQTLRLESSSLNGLFWSNFNSSLLSICEYLTCYDISCPKDIAWLRPKFIDFFRNQLPETLITGTLIWRGSDHFFEVISLISQRRSDETFILRVLKIYDIVRFDFLLW